MSEEDSLRDDIERDSKLVHPQERELRVDSAQLPKEREGAAPAGKSERNEAKLFSFSESKQVGGECVRARSGIRAGERKQ